MAEAGLREQKKQRTREAISAAAFELFQAHGFERVTVAEIARRARVSEATVFNYFPVKEDLIYSRLEAFEAQLIDAVRDRGPGVSVLAAFRDYLLGQDCLPGGGDPAALAAVRKVSRIILDSPALLARERHFYDQATHTLAALVAQETTAPPQDIRPQVVANALMGVHHAAVAHMRHHLLAGTAPADLEQGIRAQVAAGLAVLEHGLANWGTAQD